MSRVRASIVVSLAVSLAFGLSSCGETGPFEGVGERSAAWVTAATIPTTTAPPVVVEVGDEGLVGSGDLLWVNDDVGPTDPPDDPQAMVSIVWNRQIGSRFVQASRVEIATALPTMRFPEAVPEDVRWVTSQLVFDPATGLLDADTSAAFGLWIVEPYTAEGGRLGVLRVGVAPDGVGGAKSDIVPIIVPDGLSLGWTEAGLRYELFCQAAVTVEVCNAIAEAFVPLSDLLIS